jgi:hypothetical protein
MLFTPYEYAQSSKFAVTSSFWFLVAGAVRFDWTSSWLQKSSSIFIYSRTDPLRVSANINYNNFILSYLNVQKQIPNRMNHKARL